MPELETNGNIGVDTQIAENRDGVGAGDMVNLPNFSITRTYYESRVLASQCGSHRRQKRTMDFVIQALRTHRYQCLSTLPRVSPLLSTDRRIAI